MKDEELILKAVEYCNDIPARVKDFLREQETTVRAEPKSEFKVGDWVIGVNRTPYNPARITKTLGVNSDGENVVNYLYWNGEEEVSSYQSINVIRLATPAEIEAHLIEVAKKKGFIGKIFYVDPVSRGRCQLSSDPKFDYTKNDGSEFLTDGWGGAVYQDGMWAEIIPDKKDLPKTKEEFGAFLGAYCNRHTSSVAEFLKDYKD